MGGARCGGVEGRKAIEGGRLPSSFRDPCAPFLSFVRASVLFGKNYRWRGSSEEEVLLRRARCSLGGLHTLQHSVGLRQHHPRDGLVQGTGASPAHRLSAATCEAIPSIFRRVHILPLCVWDGTDTVPFLLLLLLLLVSPLTGQPLQAVSAGYGVCLFGRPHLPPAARCHSCGSSLASISCQSSVQPPRAAVARACAVHAPLSALC